MGIYRGTYYSVSSCTGSARPGAKALMSWYLGAYKARGAANLGIYVCKRLGSGYSIHGDGRACDIGTAPYGGVDSTWGWALANALRLNSAELGIQLIILGNRVWSCKQPDAGWRKYGGAYHGHAHVELTPSTARSLTVAKIQGRLGGSSSTPSTGLVPTPPLRENDFGPRVGHLQRSLNEALGLKLDVDDDFGPATKSGVLLLQRTAGITQDGIYGTDSARELTDLLEDDMQLDDVVKLRTNGAVAYSGKTATVEGVLSSNNYHAVHARNLALTLVGEQAKATALLQQLAAGQSGLTEEAIAAAVAAGVQQAIDPAELAAAVAEAVDHDLDTAAVEAALRSVFGQLDGVGE